MNTRKTNTKDRNVYRYPVDVPDGRGGYRRIYFEIKPGDKFLKPNTPKEGKKEFEVVTEDMIRTLHKMDDNEVYNNVKNGHPSMTEEQKVLKREWEKAHLGEKYPMGWNLSFDYEFDSCDGDVSKSSVLSGASFNPIDEMYDLPDDVMKLREIVAQKMTDRQRQAYDLIVLQEYNITEAGKIMGISATAAKKNYDRAIDCIKKYF